MRKKIIIGTETQDLYILSDFIKSNPKGGKTFRYFSKRDLSVISNHIFTCLYYNNNNDIIGYGHLDFESDKIWLGIIVSDEYHGRGYGGLIMDDLISQTSEPIYLSVDNDNEIAFRLYKNKGFSIFEENNKYKIMIKENG
jgi:RimJ/RimL family protein N-acetyltransferase